MKDGSRSDCDAPANQVDCDPNAPPPGWEKCYYIDVQNCGCDGVLPWSERMCQGQHPYYKGDTTPAHAPRLINWRYVVVVNCKDVGKDCEEQHKLLRCGCDPGSPGPPVIPKHE